jgi:hypothetical protein
MSPRWGSTPRQTDWLTVSRNLTLLSTLHQSQSQLRSSTNYNRSQPAAARFNALSPHITQPRIATIQQYTGTFPTRLTSRATDCRPSRLPLHIIQNPAALFRATTHRLSQFPPHIIQKLSCPFQGHDSRGDSIVLGLTQWQYCDRTPQW